jgi:hypothetical protein
MNKTAAKSAKKNLRRKVNFRSEFLYLCSCCAMVLLLSLAGFNINDYVVKSNVLGAKAISGEDSYRSIIEEKNYWQEFLKITPNYLDGWIELISLNLNLNDKNSAKEAFIKAREIDPNSLKLGPYQELFED